MYSTGIIIGVRADFFLGGRAEPSLPENFSTAPEKTAMLTCKITSPDSPHPVIISKNPRFQALYEFMNELLCPSPGGCSPQPPGSYAYDPN